MASTETTPEGAATPTTSGALAASPFTIREWVLGGVAVAIFILGLIPMYGGYGYGANLWSAGFIIGGAITLLPMIAAALILLRRVVPTLPRRVGSLTLDQFASVAGWVSLSYVSFLLFGAFTSSLVILPFLLVLVWVFFASFAHLVPPFNTEFTERPAAQAISLLARPDVLPLPVVVKPVVAAAPPVPGAPQPFWALSPEERPVVDANGATLFTVGPTAWALVVEDRGTEYVIRHDNGTTGVLKDLTGVTRA